MQLYFVLLGFHAHLVVASSLSLLHPPYTAKPDVPLSFFLEEESWIATNLVGADNLWPANEPSKYMPGKAAHMLSTYSIETQKRKVTSGHCSEQSFRGGSVICFCPLMEVHRVENPEKNRFNV